VGTSSVFPGGQAQGLLPLRHGLPSRQHALQLTDNIQAAYLKADPTERRLLNQAFFEHLEIDNEEIADRELAAPFAQLAPITGVAVAATSRRGAGIREASPYARTPGPPKKVEGSYVKHLVDRNGLEPATAGRQPPTGTGAQVARA